MKKLYSFLSLFVALLFGGQAMAVAPGIANGINSQASTTDTATFTFAVAQNSYFSFSTYKSGGNVEDPLLKLYNTTTMETIAIADNNAGLDAVIADVVLTPGDYAIQYVNKVSSGGASRNFILDAQVVLKTVFEAGSRSNDNLANAKALVLNTPVADTNVYATVQGLAGEGNLAGALNGKWSETSTANSLWYTFTATAADAHTIKFTDLDITTNTSSKLQVAVYTATGAGFTGLSLIANGEFANATDSLNVFCLTAGQSYTVLVDVEGISTATYEISVGSYELPATVLVLTAVDTTTNINGVSCPLDSIRYTVKAEVLNAIDSTVIDAKYQAYIDFLTLSIDPTTASFDGVTVANFDDLLEDTYTVTVTDVCGSTLSESITFTDTIPDPVSIILSDLKDADCLVTGTGSVSVAVEGGIKYLSGPNYTPHYAYNSDPEEDFSVLANFPATTGLPTLTALPIGIYKLFYEDACGTYDSVQFVINNPEYTLVSVDSIGGVNPNCALSSTGSLLLSGSGGQNAGLTYEWYFDATNDTTLVFGNLLAETTKELKNAAAGLYAAIVADACTDSAGINRDTIYLTLTDPVFDALVVSIDSIAPSAYNSNDGSATINRVGGSGLDSVVWSFNGVEVTAFENMMSINGLSQGLYKAVYNDDCLDTNITFTFNLFAPLANDDICNAITIAEGDSIIRFNNIGSTIQTGEETISIPVHPVTGWSAENKVQSSVWFKFVAPASGAITVDVKTTGFPFANLSFDPQVAIFGGACTDVAALQLLSANDNNVAMSPGNNNNSFQTVTCLTPGTEYYILVDGFAGLGEQGYFSIEIEEQTILPIVLNPSVTPISCNAPTATLTLPVLTGGVGTIVVTFDSDTLSFPGGVATVNDINPGVYELIAYDKCGVADSETITVEGFENKPFAIAFDITSPVCPGGSDGIVDFTFGGGASVGSYTFFVLDNVGDTVLTKRNVGLTYELTGLEAGEYSATIEDNCDNEKEFVFEVVDVTLDNVTASFDITQPECNGATGDVTATISGGSSIFYYSVGTDINTLDAGLTRDTNSFDLENLAAGTYYLLVRDYCIGLIGDTSLIDSFKVVDPNLDALTIAVTNTNPSANGLSDGGFSFVISGGKMPYTAKVYNYAGNVKGDTIAITANAVSGLAAGPYRIEYSDDCTAGVIAKTVTLLNPPASNVVCNASLLTLGATVTGDNSAATLTAVDATVPAPANNASCFVAGTWCGNDGITAPLWYKFVVPTSGSVIVDLNSGNFDPQLAVYKVSDCSNGSGFVLLGASDDQSSTNDDSKVRLSCQTPGDTLYVLVDANEVPVAKRRGSFSITVSNNSNLTLKVFDIITNASTNVSTNGKLDIDIVGGAAPYTIVWADKVNAPEDRTNLAPGTYTVTVTDACGVSVTRVLVVGFNERENDRTCTAKALMLNSTVTVSTLGANATPGEPSPSTNGTCTSAETFAWCGNDGVNNSVWYTFVAPASGAVAIDMCSGTNGFDTQLAVYTATNCADFNTFDLVAANDDQDATTTCSKLDLTGLTPCAVYYVQVDSKGATGVATMNITATATSFDAGNDASVLACVYDNAFDLSDLLSATAQTGGVYVDSANTGALTGSNFDLASLSATAGTAYTFYYVVGEKCNGNYIAADAAKLVVTADNCVGVTESASAKVNVYPNPANNEVFVSNTSAEVVYILTTDGKQVASQVNTGNVRFDISNLASGVYTVVAGNDKVRLVIQ